MPDKIESNSIITVAKPNGIMLIKKGKITKSGKRYINKQKKE